MPCHAMQGALKMIHDRQIIHADVKPENCLLAADSPGRSCSHSLKAAEYPCGQWLCLAYANSSRGSFSVVALDV